MKSKIMSKRTLIAVLLVVTSLVSMFVVSRYASSAEVHSVTINSLNEKQNTVLAITAAAATSATVISMIPGDATTAIANQILDISSYLFLVVCVIFLEKILITVFGYISFSLIIPTALVLFLIYLYNQKKVLKMLAIKLIIFAVALFMIIPLSVKISTLIEDANKETIEYATQVTGETELSDTEKGESKNILEKAVDKVKVASKKNC